MAAFQPRSPNADLEPRRIGANDLSYRGAIMLSHVRSVARLSMPPDAHRTTQSLCTLHRLQIE